MPRIKHLSIPKPCHEDWHQMTATDKGNYCQSCCKTVVDFTEMSNAEVIAYLSAHTNTCGRITVNKMASVNNQLELENRKRFSWKGLVAAASLSMLFPAIQAKAQSQPNTEQAAASPNIEVEKKPADSVAYITVSGVVKAKDDGLPVVGATVRIKDKPIGAVTAADGSFSFRIPVSEKFIQISYLGYQTQKLKLRNKRILKSIILHPVLEPTIMGDIRIAD